MTQLAVVTSINNLTGVLTCCTIVKDGEQQRVLKLSEARDLNEGTRIMVTPISLHWARVVRVVSYET